MPHARRSEPPVPSARLGSELQELVTEAATGSGFRLAAPLTRLAADEIVVLVIDRSSVTMERAKASPPGRLRDGVRRRIALRVAAIDLAASRLDEEAAEERIHGSAFSSDEQAALKEGGLVRQGIEGRRPDPVAQAQAEFARLRADALDVNQAAALLGVNTSRVRQRLTSARPTLVGMKIGERWCLPKFQFQRRGLVPGLERIIPALPSDLDPVSLFRWLTSPDDDLEIAGGDTVSPLDWLAMGKDPAAVAALAQDL